MAEIEKDNNSIDVNGNITITASLVDTIEEGDYVYWSELSSGIFQVKSIDVDYVWFTDGTCLRSDALNPKYKSLYKVILPETDWERDSKIIAEDIDYINQKYENEKS